MFEVTQIRTSFYKKGRKVALLGLKLCRLLAPSQPKPSFCNFWQHVIFIKSYAIIPSKISVKLHNSICVLLAKIILDIARH